jgi:hypothetical protein
LGVINVLTVMPPPPPHWSSHHHLRRTTASGVGLDPRIPISTRPAPPGVQQRLYDPSLEQRLYDPSLEQRLYDPSLEMPLPPPPPPPFQPSYVGGYPGLGAGQFNPADMGMNGGVNIPPGYAQPYGAFHHPQQARLQPWGYGHYPAALGPAGMQPNEVEVDDRGVGEQAARGVESGENEGAVSSVGRPKKTCPNKEISEGGAS